MGVLRSGSSSFDMDDRLLAHLQLVIGMKLGRGERFFMSWRAGTGEGAGRRHAIWIDNGVPIHFEYSGGREPRINRAWAESLVESAAHTGGLIIRPEDPPNG